MIFERIALTNLFSYYGEQTIELGRPPPGRNVCLIMGRNGFGKTSLLNSLKLLFTGVRYEPLRRAVQRSRMPTINQYVVGAGDDWWGIMNRRARQEGATACSVRVTWSEASGEVVAERAWRIESGAWDGEERLTIKVGEQTLHHEEAQAFLDRRLPQNYVYFFLFDGEQIQELAEARREVQQREMERILGIGAIESLREALNQSILRWQRDEMAPQARAELERLEGETRALTVELAEAERNRAALAEEIDGDEDALRRVRRRIEGLSAFVHRHDEAQLTERRRQLESEYLDARKRLSAELPRDVALLANPSLVTKALARLDSMLGSDASTKTRLLESLISLLPGRLFSEPDFPDPDIREGQRAFYRYKLVSLLEREADAAGRALDPTFAPNPQAAAAARDQLAAYAEADALRSARASALARLQGQAAELRRLEADLLNVGSLSEEERGRYERYVAERGELERRLSEKHERLGQIDSTTGSIQRKLLDLNKQIEEKKSSIQKSRLAEEKIEVARRLGNLFGALKDRRKREQQAALSEAVNRHFRVLMTSHHLVECVEVDDDFGLHYFDCEGRPIAMGSLSAGMKQLMATALLWALSEVSGRQVPVVIDTPLARIDSENQDAILTEYYPHAAAQVIVLPTNSELDERKLRLISGHVYVAYRLTNPDGEHTVLRRVDPAHLLQGV